MFLKKSSDFFSHFVLASVCCIRTAAIIIFLRVADTQKQFSEYRVQSAVNELLFLVFAKPQISVIHRG